MDDLFDFFFPPESLNPEGELPESCEGLMTDMVHRLAARFFKCNSCKLRHSRAERSCVEIERKFLVADLPDLTEACGVHVLQGYVVSGDKEVRLRVEDSAHFTLTIKNDGTLVRKEYEIDLSKEQFEVLWPTVEGTLEKYRYCIPYGSYIIELSIYLSSLKGLVIAEIEFASEKEAKDFRPPKWLAEDITEDKQYKNKNLAGKEYTNEYFTHQHNARRGDL